MIRKELTIPHRILMSNSLLGRIPTNHPKRESIENDFIRRKVGYQGEQNVKYHLGFLNEKEYDILFNLRLPLGELHFEIDVLMITTRYILIMEVKNYSGTLIFEKYSDQLIRVLQNKEEKFPNPIFQAQRHQIQLERFLSKHHFPKIPLEHLVVISNTSTRISSIPENPDIHSTVIHAEKILSKMEEINQKYRRQVIKRSTIDRLTKFLIEFHTPDIPDIKDHFELTKDDIIKGVKCPSCNTYAMLRKHAKWYCPSCHANSKQAHELAILDYLLLINTSFQNRDCQYFLQISNRKVTERLLTSMNLPFSGQNGGRKYQLPSIDYLEAKLSPVI